jgi:hypothetical protein
MNTRQSRENRLKGKGLKPQSPEPRAWSLEPPYGAGGAPVMGFKSQLNV